MRRLATFGILFLGLAGSAQAQQARLPASYPHDMTQFDCRHRDDGACDNAPLPPPDYNPLVGTWVRYSLLRNGFSVQPPDAPLVVDPVMAAKGGAPLVQPETVDVIRSKLLPRAERSSTIGTAGSEGLVSVMRRGATGTTGVEVCVERFPLRTRRGFSAAWRAAS